MNVGPEKDLIGLFKKSAVKYGIPFGVICFNPGRGMIEIPSLGLQSPYNAKKISSIKLLGSNLKISFKQNNDKLQLTIPETGGDTYTKVFEVKGVL